MTWRNYAALAFGGYDPEDAPVCDKGQDAPATVRHGATNLCAPCALEEVERTDHAATWGCDDIGHRLPCPTAQAIAEAEYELGLARERIRRGR